MLKQVSLLFITLILSSCSLISFEEMEISSNLKEDNSYFNEEKLILTFSQIPDYDSLENNITLRCDNSTIEYSLLLNGNKAYLKPVEGWTNSSTYKLSLSGDLKDTDNKYFAVSFFKTFIYGTKDDTFYIVSYSLPDKKTSDRNDIVIQFNKPVSKDSLEKALNLTPYIKTKTELSEDHLSFKVTPQSSWTVNTWFNIKLENLKSESNHRLTTDFSKTFLPDEDLLFPELISICPGKDFEIKDNSFTSKQGIEDFSISNVIQNFSISDFLVFTFNKPVNLQSLKNNLTLTPALSGTFIQKDSQILFIPEHNLKIGTNYQIKISSNVKDLNEMTLPTDYFFTFVPLNDFLKITSIKMNTSENIEHVSNHKNDDKIYPVTISSSRTLFVQLSFSKSLSINSIQGIEKALILEPFFPKNNSYPKLTKVSWNPRQDTVTLEYTNINSQHITDAIYRLNINSSSSYLYSTDNEYLEEDSCVLFYAN